MATEKEEKAPRRPRKKAAVETGKTDAGVASASNALANAGKAKVSGGTPARTTRRPRKSKADLVPRSELEAVKLRCQNDLVRSNVAVIGAVLEKLNLPEIDLSPDEMASILERADVEATLKSITPTVINYRLLPKDGSNGTDEL